MSQAVKVHQSIGRPIAVVRRNADHQSLSKVVPECCGIVWQALKTLGVAAGRHVAVYLDEVITVEVGVELLAPFTGSGDVRRSSTPAGLVASAVHWGPYRNLGETHSAIVQWCRTSGLTLAGPNWEFYGHWRDEWNRDPSKIRTDVFYLLKT